MTSTDIYRYQVTLDRITAAGRPNKDRTYTAWRQTAAKAREALKNVKADFDKQAADLKETYSTKEYMVSLT